MGKRDTKAAKAKRAERRGKGALKTGEKTIKSEQKQQRREANRQDDEDLEKVLKELAALQATEAVAGEAVVPPPSPRVNSSFTLHPSGNEILLFGGEHYDGKKCQFYSQLFRYSIKRNEWRLVTVKKSPPPRSSHQAVAVPTGGGSLFIFGGEFSSTNQTQFYHYRDMWCLDLSTWTWEQVQAKNGPSARSGHRMVHCRDKLVVFGGFFDNLRDARYYNDAYIFDLNFYQWHKISIEPGAIVPQPRSGCSLAADGAAGVVYLYGGYYKKKVVMQQFDVHKDKSEVGELSETGVEFRDAWKLDLFGDVATGARPGTWAQLKKSGSAPSSRSGNSMVLHRNRLVVFGGVHDDDTPEGDGLISQFYSDLYSYSLDTGRWHQLTVERKVKKPANANSETVDDDAAVEEDVSATDLFTLGGGRRRNRNRVDSNDNEPSRSSKTTTEVVPVASEPVNGDNLAPVPCPRMNHRVALKGNVMFVYGGLYEPEESVEITLNDLWTLDLSKLDGWNCLHKGIAIEDAMVRDESDDSEDELSGEEEESAEESSSSSDESEKVVQAQASTSARSEVCTSADNASATTAESVGTGEVEDIEEEETGEDP